MLGVGNIPSFLSSTTSVRGRSTSTEEATTEIGQTFTRIWTPIVGESPRATLPKQETQPNDRVCTAEGESHEGQPHDTQVSHGTAS